MDIEDQTRGKRFHATLAIASLGLIAFTACGGTATKTVTLPGQVVYKDVPGPTVYVTPAACKTALVAYEASVSSYHDAVGKLTSDAGASQGQAGYVNAPIWNSDMAAVNAAIDSLSVADTATANSC